MPPCVCTTVVVASHASLCVYNGGVYASHASRCVYNGGYTRLPASLCVKRGIPASLPLSRFTVGQISRLLVPFPFHCLARIASPSPVSLLG